MLEKLTRTYRPVRAGWSAVQRRSRANFSRADFLCVCDALVGRLMYFV